MRISFFRGALFCAVLFVFFSCSNEIYGPDFHSDSQPDSNGHVQKEVRVIDINDLEGKYLVHYSEDENTLWLSHRHVSDGNLEHCSIDFSTNKFYVEKTPFRRNDDGSICYGFERVYNDSKEQYEWECSLLRAEQYNESLIYLRRGFWHDHAGIYSNEENPENVLFDASRCFDGSLQYFEENEVYVVKNSAARIRFYPNGPDEDYEEYIWPVGEKLQIPDIKYDFGVEIDGYDFYGWSENPEEGYADVRSYSFCSFDRDINLYPIWGHEVSYTITFDANGSQFYRWSTKEYSETKTQTASEKTAAKKLSAKLVPCHYDDGISICVRKVNNTEYQFKGWATSPISDVVEYSDGDWIELSGDITLYAVWACPKHHYINFDANGGSLTSSSQMLTAYGLEFSDEIPPMDCDIKLAQSIGLSRPGYRFRGWALESDAEDVLYADGASLTITRDITLYALWDKEVTYTVTFKRNTNGAYITTETQSITGTELTGVHGNLLTADELGLYKPYATGYYQFTGWAESTSGGAVYGNGGTIELTEDTTLYATWYLPTYTIRYCSGNKCYEEITVKGYKADIWLKSASDLGISKSGFTFKGWKIAYGSWIYSPGEVLEVTGNYQFNAEWIEDCFWIQLYYPGSQSGEKLTCLAYALTGTNADISGAWSYSTKSSQYSPVVKISGKGRQLTWLTTYSYVTANGSTGFVQKSGSRTFAIGNHYTINVVDGSFSIN